MKTLLVLTAALLLSGCTGNMLTSEYSEGGNLDITTASTEYLVKKYPIVNNHSSYALEAMVIKEELKRRHPFYDWDRIFKGKAAIGMTKEEVILSWGRPYDVNRASYGDQWIYQSSYKGRSKRYLYFSPEGICTSWN